MYKATTVPNTHCHAGADIVHNISIQLTPLFVHNVHRYFKPKTHFGCNWCCPHIVSPLDKLTSSLERCSSEHKENKV
jgi:hypothetical protein